MNAVICDRCGKIIKNEFYVYNSMRLFEGENTFMGQMKKSLLDIKYRQDLHFCLDCADAIIDFIHSYKSEKPIERSEDNDTE